MKILLIFILSLLFTFTACKTNEFRLKGIYEAPKSQYRVEIVSEGKIESGADISNDSVTKATIMSIRELQPQFTIEVENKPERKMVTVKTKESQKQYEAGDVEKILRETFQSSGYKVTDIGEVKETATAIYGASSGWKGALMPGQSMYLKVIEVKPN